MICVDVNPDVLSCVIFTEKNFVFRGAKKQNKNKSASVFLLFESALHSSFFCGHWYKETEMHTDGSLKTHNSRRRAHTYR